MEPTQEQILNAAIFLDGEHPEVAAMLVRMAEQPVAAKPYCNNKAGTIHEFASNAGVGLAQKENHEIHHHPCRGLCAGWLRDTGPRSARHLV